MTMDKTEAPKANDDSGQREASQYWGYLIRNDKCGTDKFDRLLRGIATVISTTFEPYDSSDLTPSQLAAFYRAVGGDYDVLFKETPPSTISFIYRSLGAFHSLQPAPDDDGYKAPCIPALKAKGFVTWQTIQLLLGPEEHVPLIQKAVELYDVRDPKTGELFPKVLPKECFPDRPDDAMEEWYQGVADRLQREAEMEAAEKQEPTRVRVEVHDRGPRTSSETSDYERHGAATYFSDPLYRRTRTRPGYARHFSKQSPYADDRESVVGRVRHMLNPFHKDSQRRRPSPSKYLDPDDYSDVDATPIATVPPEYVATHRYRYPEENQKRSRMPRREGSVSSTDSSDSEFERRENRRSSPVLRHRRSHEPTAPREYFPPMYDDRERRYSHETTPEPRRKEPEGPSPPLYGPTKAPLFATQVAQMQQNYTYDRRPPAVSARASYTPSNVRYTVKPDLDPRYVRDGDRARERERERGRKDYESVASASRPRERPRRRSDDEYPRERDRRGAESLRTRSHDGARDEWREREDDDRDGRVRARYTSSSGSVQDGVGGRRYPVEQAWR